MASKRLVLPSASDRGPLDARTSKSVGGRIRSRANVVSGAASKSFSDRGSGGTISLAIFERWIGVVIGTLQRVRFMTSPVFAG